VSRRSFLWFSSFLAALFIVLAAAHDASAASNDEEVEALVQSVLEGDYLNTNFKDAIDKLGLAKQACEGKKSCSPKVRAKVYIALGTVLAGGEKKIAEATEAFVIALKEDPTATLYGDLITPEVQKAFNDARGVATSSTGSVEVKPGQERKPKKVYKGGVKPPRGWKSGEAFFYYREALAAEKERDWLICNDYAQASLAAENRPSTRMLAATCEERAGLWIEAFADYKIVADTAGTRKYGLYDVAARARGKGKELSEKIPKIIFRKPAKAQDLVVKMNDAIVPPEKVGGEIWVNPGQRVVQATGKIEGVELEFEQVVDLVEFETVTVDIRLAPKGAKDRVLTKCVLEAKTREDFAKCVGASSTSVVSGLNLRVGAELSGYHDTDHVDVLTPAISLGVESPTDGWGINGAFLVDVVTAASADIIATASPRWTETRYVPALGGHKKFGDVDVSLRASMSIEPDYLAIGGGAGVAVDLAQKTITPSLTYDFGYDISGRAGTSYAEFSREIQRHAIDAGVTFIVDKSTFVATSLTAVFESGDSSKPYRYIPLFAPEDVTLVPPGLSVEGVAEARRPERVLEQVPMNRQRWAVSARAARRFASSTLRAEERLYIDSWGLKASTTDARYLVDVTDTIRLWPHLRFHAQSGVDFWKIAYPVTRDVAGNRVTVPALRTGDRELGPFLSLTLGGGGRFAFGEKKDWALTLTADVIYSRFLDHLYILQRFGYFGATTLEVEFE
jgi:hypothetical protein